MKISPLVYETGLTCVSIGVTAGLAALLSTSALAGAATGLVLFKISSIVNTWLSNEKNQYRAVLMSSLSGFLIGTPVLYFSAKLLNVGITLGTAAAISAPGSLIFLAMAISYITLGDKFLHLAEET